LYNFNDFTFNQFIEVVTDLKRKFGIIPENIPLNNLEFGVNLIISYSPSIFIDELLHHKGKGFNVTKRNKMHYSECGHTQYSLKIYNKGLQFNRGNILRFELRFFKMQSLNKIGIYTLSDLINVDVWKMFGEMLRKEFDSLIYYDSSINYSTITAEEQRKNSKKATIEQRILELGNNPKFWNSLSNRTTKMNYTDRFKSLVNEHGKYQFYKIGEQITGKVDELINFENINVFTDQQINDSNLNFNVFTYMLSCKYVNPSTFNSDKSKVCIITGLDISMQKENSKFLSYVGLKYYFENYSYIFEILKRQFLSDLWTNCDFQTQIKEIAHNIRNKHSNLRIKQNRLYPKKQCSILFS